MQGHRNEIFLGEYLFFFFAGVKEGPLYDSSGAWFNLARFIVDNMKNSQVDKCKFIFAVFHVPHNEPKQAEPGSSDVYSRPPLTPAKKKEF